jgi:hypothetical protein
LSGFARIFLDSFIFLLIISDFVGVLHCAFIRCINALKGQQAHSVGQRPTKEINEHHSGQRPNNNFSF